MKAIDKIKQVMPKGRHFRAGEVAHDIYPHLEGTDTEGRCYNFGSSTVARLLRKIPLVLETEHGLFMAPKEWWSDK